MELPFRPVVREMAERFVKLDKHPQRADRASNSTR